MNAILGDLPAYLGPSASFLAAAAALSLGSSKRWRQSWRVYGWSLMLFGIGSMLWSVAFELPYLPGVPVLAGAATLSSLVLLLEFGRLDSGDEPLFNPSFYVPVAGLSLAGLAIDYSAMLPLLILAWSIPAGILSARTFWKAADVEVDALGRLVWRALAASSLLGGASLCLVSAHWLFPIPESDGIDFLSKWLFMCLWPFLALPVVFTMLERTLRSLSEKEAKTHGRLRIYSACFLCLAFIMPLVVLHWTNKATDMEAKLDRKDRMATARLVDESVYGARMMAKSVSELLASTPGVREWLEKESGAASPRPKWLISLLERQRPTLPPQSICYLLGKDGTCLAASVSENGKDITGRRFAFRNYFKQALESGRGEEVAVGSLTLEPGLFCACAVYSKNGEYIGAAVVKTGLRRCLEIAGSEACLLLNPDGKVMVSNKVAYEQMDADSIADAQPLAESKRSVHWLRGKDANSGGKMILLASETLPGWKIALAGEARSSIRLYRAAGIGMAALLSLAFAGAFAMKHIDFWGAVAVRRTLAWRDAILESQTAGVAILDGTFTILEANKRFCAMFCCQPESLRELKLGALFKSFRTYENFLREASATVLGAGSYTTGLELQDREGNSLWCEVSGRGIEDSPRSSASVWLFIDKSESKRSMDMLKDSEERYKSIFENASIGIAVYGSDGRCLMANQAYSAIAGGPIASILKQDFRLIKSWQSSGLLGLAEATLHDGKPRELMTVVSTSFGKEVTVRCTVTSSPFGRSRLLTLMVEDQSLKAEAERLLKASLAKYESLFKIMPAAAFTVDPAGIVSSFNSMAETITGYSAHEVIGEPCKLFMEEPCRSSNCALFNRETRLPIVNKECYVLTKDGRRRIVVKSSDLMRDAQGSLQGGIETFFDITPLKEAESKLAAACKEAERNASQKTEAIAGIGHELRSLANGIIGFSMILMRTGLSVEQKDGASGLLQCGGRLLFMINSLLEIARIEAGGLDLAPGPADLNALVPDTIEALFGKAAAKNLKISFELAPGTPTLLKTDPFRLRQVLFNLMDNAIDRAGEGEILVKAGKADGSAKIRFEIVARDGGIPKELLPQIFSMPSMENAPNLSAARKGSGLPLALSKMLVELLGGSIGVRNDEEGRSVFHFEIPAREMDDYLYSSKEPARKPPRSGATAILYEPETVDLLIVSSYLKRLGCLVGEAFSTEMLAEQLQRLACAVVVFDMQPDEPQALDSFKKLRKLKKGDGKSGVLSLAIVADADGELARRCLQIGMDGVVRRPANFTQFVDEIAPWLEKLDSSGSGSLAGVLASGSNGASPAESLELRLLMEHVLDKKQLASVCADDVQILDGVLELSPKEFEHLALKLGEAVAGNDMKNAALVAHSLKGASANIGGRRLSLLCKEVEMEAKAGRVEEAKDGLVRIEAEIKEFFAAVKAYRDALT